MRKTVTVSVKLPVQVAARVATLAKGRKTSRSHVIREAVEAYAQTQDTSALSAVRHLVGVGRGPGDLSTNPKYLRGYGKQ